MTFSLNEAKQLLERTPSVLALQLTGLPEHWIHSHEGGDTWSPYAVVGHLVHGERTDWIPRLKIIMAAEGNKTFEPFDRFAMLQWDPSISLATLLEEFKILRQQNLLELDNLSQSDLSRAAIHPEFGSVTLAQLIAAWVAHDLSHLTQVSRVLAFQYREAVGPWQAYMSIYKR